MSRNHFAWFYLGFRKQLKLIELTSGNKGQLLIVDKIICLNELLIEITGKYIEMPVHAASSQVMAFHTSDFLKTQKKIKTKSRPIDNFVPYEQAHAR